MDTSLLQSLLFLLYESDRSNTLREKGAMLLSAAEMLRCIVEQENNIPNIIIYDAIISPEQKGEITSGQLKDIKVYRLETKEEVIFFIVREITIRLLRYLNDSRLLMFDYLMYLPALSNGSRTILDVLWGTDLDASKTALKTAHIPLYHFEKAKNFIWQILLQLRPAKLDLPKVVQKLGVNLTKQNSLPTY